MTTHERADDDVLDVAAAREVVVVGGGTMGAGIAQLVLDTVPEARVHLVDRDAASMDAASGRVRDGLRLRHKRAKDPEALADRFLQRLVPTVCLPAGVAADLVVEAVPEDLSLKAAVLSQASTLYPDAVLATNTSSLSVTALSSSVESPERFLGMHFFNPVPRSELIEIIVTPTAATATVAMAHRWANALGKQTIEVRDVPGFATSRLGVAIALEAMRMLEQGVASADDIDRGMVLGYKHPMGPLELTDLVGLDVRLAIAEHLASELGPRFEPPEILRDLVAAGRLGKKSGQGFHDWTSR